ncbi:hypothetical protein [Dictyobacter kobayashii]|uniref:Uncharacterized protein n=1 Tax=Dictyobacter kobayashii TaxID=2014872 RepID=A0A402AGY7_9CHLR|nr:hypothetical protein [Dictyobacter kobayashii]GCE18372.1 hypothetical protein KDK_21720 [Dictyobacter kobayashii]
MRGIDGFHRSLSLLLIHIMNLLIQPAIETEDIICPRLSGGDFFNEAAYRNHYTQAASEFGINSVLVLHLLWQTLSDQQHTHRKEVAS